MTSMEDLEAEFRRARALLSAKRTQLTFELTPPPWEASGSLSATGLAAEGLPAKLGLYLFASGTEAQKAGTALRETLAGGGANATSTTNGALLLVGQVAAGKDEDASALKRIASAFAGRE